MKKLYIVGAGGFGRELLWWVKDINAKEPTWEIMGFLDDNPNALDGCSCDYSVVGTIKDCKPADDAYHGHDGKLIEGACQMHRLQGWGYIPCL